VIVSLSNARTRSSEETLALLNGRRSWDIAEVAFQTDFETGDVSDAKFERKSATSLTDSG
jgi:hypothetical protein